MAPAEAQPAPSITVGATPPPADGKKCALILVPSNDVTVASRARAGAAKVRAAARARAAAHEIRLIGSSVGARADQAGGRLTRCAAVFDLSGHVAVVTGGNSGI